MNPGASDEVTPTIRNTRRIIFIILAVTLLVPLGSCVMWRARNASAVKALEQAARERGEPVTFAELRALYGSVPDSENSYILLEELWTSEDPEYWTAFRELRPTPDRREKIYPDKLPVLGNDRWWSRTDPLEPDRLDVLKTFMASNATHLTTVRLALQRPHYRAHHKFENGLSMLLPDLARLREEAMLFQLDALQAMEAGDASRAISAIEDIARVGHYLDHEPLLISQLVRISIFTTAINATERLTTRTKLSMEDLNRLQGVLVRLECRAGLKLALLGERVMGRSTYAATPEQLTLASTPEESRQMAFGMKLAAATGYSNADLRLMLETYEQLIDIADQPDFMATAVFSTTVANAATQAHRFPPKFMTALLVPALGKAAERFARLESLRRSAIAALSVLKFTLNHPDSTEPQWRKLIDSLANDLGKDPMTDEPLKLVVRGNTVIIYSVGFDLSDDGGQVEAPHGTRATAITDFGFTVERSPQK